jgi:hypothetical protein
MKSGPAKGKAPLEERKRTNRGLVRSYLLPRAGKLMGVREVESPQEALRFRVHRAVDELLKTVSDRDALAAVAEPSDMSAMVVALKTARLPPTRLDPQLMNAHLRGLAAKERLLVAEGGCLSAGELGELLGISRQAIDKRRANRTLLAVRERPGADWRYPAWQVHDGSYLEGLEEVLAALHKQGIDVWSALAFFVDAELDADGGSAIAALREGRVSDVLRAARAYGAQGAT